MNLLALAVSSIGIGIGVVIALYFLMHQAASDAINSVLDERGLGRRK